MIEVMTELNHGSTVITKVPRPVGNFWRGSPSSSPFVIRIQASRIGNALLTSPHPTGTDRPTISLTVPVLSSSCFNANASLSGLFAHHPRFLFARTEGVITKWSNKASMDLVGRCSIGKWCNNSGRSTFRNSTVQARRYAFIVRGGCTKKKRTQDR